MEQLAKNQLHTAEITGYTSDGAGVCHIAGRAVFVKGALAGETWQVRILKVTANAVYGKAEQCLSPVPARTQPPCPVYRTCGGCSLQHMDYDEQLRMKLQRVNDALTRIGGVSMPVQDIIGMEYPLCYRNKAIYAVGTKDGRVVKGFYRASSHDITPVEQCLLQLPLADKAAQAVCDWMDLRGVAPYDEATGRGTVRHLFTRCAMHTPDAVLCIVSARGFGAQTDGLIAYLREHCPELTGIVLDVNKQKGNVVLAGDFYPLWGVPELTDRLCGLTFTLSPQAFYQVNPVQAERLYERAVEYAVNAPTDQVLSVITNFSTFMISLSKACATGLLRFLKAFISAACARPVYKANKARAQLQLSYYTQITQKSKAPIVRVPLFSVLPRIRSDILKICLFFSRFRHIPAVRRRFVTFYHT